MNSVHFNATLNNTIDGKRIVSSPHSSPSTKEERIKRVKANIFELVRFICRGAAQLQPNSPSRKLNINYWQKEVTFRNHPYSYREASLLRDLWKKSEDPSFFDFVSKTVAAHQIYVEKFDPEEFLPEEFDPEEFDPEEFDQKEFDQKEFDPTKFYARIFYPEKYNSPLNLESWLTIHFLHQTERAIWKDKCKNNPKENLSFENWWKDQAHTIKKFGIPLWSLLKYHENTDYASLARDFTNRYGLSLKPQYLAKKQFLYKFANSCLDFHLQTLKEQQKHSDSTEDLERYIMRLEHKNKVNPDEFDAYFDKHKKEQDTAERDLYKARNSNLPFDIWKKIQLTNPYNESPCLTRCTPELRAYFLTTVNNGVLSRNGHPLNTEFEIVDRQKECIFVIGPDDNLYCASKVRRVFQHSSFFNDGIVCTAGALKTDKEGHLKSLSNSSGHYRSGEQSNLFMMKYFLRHGVDLSKVHFFIHGNAKAINAKEYYDKLCQS